MTKIYILREKTGEFLNFAITMADTQYLDKFETILTDGLQKILKGCGVMKEGMLPDSEDILSIWQDSYLESYVGDAVENFNQYPEAALAWAAYLGMGVANNWDKDWAAHSKDAYTSYYGPRGWDDMDEYITGVMLHLKEDWIQKLCDAFYSCAESTLALIRHEGIEPQTPEGFYILVRSYCVFYKLGAAVELQRLGYSKVKL